MAWLDSVATLTMQNNLNNTATILAACSYFLPNLFLKFLNSILSRTIPTTAALAAASPTNGVSPEERLCSTGSRVL